MTSGDRTLQQLGKIGRAENATGNEAEIRFANGSGSANMPRDSRHREFTRSSWSIEGENMKKTTFLCSLLGLTLLLTLSISAAPQKSVTVEGYVLDSACAFTKGLDKPISRDCALACAKEGSQLVILTNDGSIYWPIDSATPAKGQNAKLLEFAGNRVKATGKLYERSGSRALVIDTIAAVK
jgi:hypothetical protein